MFYRTSVAAGLLGLVFGALCPVGGARAGVTYDFVFRSTDVTGAVIAGGNANLRTFSFTSPTAALACNPGTGVGCPVIDLILINTDALADASISFGYDTSFGLAVAQAAEWVGIPGIGAPLVPGVTCSNALQRCSSFEFNVPAPAGPPSLAPGTYHIGTIVWDTSGAGGYVNALLTLLVPGINGTGAVLPAGSGNLVAITGTEVLWSGAILIPEPATATLLGLGLLGVVLLGRARRR